MAVRAARQKPHAHRRIDVPHTHRWPAESMAASAVAGTRATRRGAWPMNSDTSGGGLKRGSSLAPGARSNIGGGGGGAAFADVERSAAAGVLLRARLRCDRGLVATGGRVLLGGGMHAGAAARSARPRGGVTMQLASLPVATMVQASARSESGSRGCSAGVTCAAGVLTAGVPPPAAGAGVRGGSGRGVVAFNVLSAGDAFSSPGGTWVRTGGSTGAAAAGSGAQRCLGGWGVLTTDGEAPQPTSTLDRRLADRGRGGGLCEGDAAVSISSAAAAGGALAHSVAAAVSISSAAAAGGAPAHSVAAAASVSPAAAARGAPSHSHSVAAEGLLSSGASHALASCASVGAGDAASAARGCGKTTAAVESSGPGKSCARLSQTASAGTSSLVATGGSAA